MSEHKTKFTPGPHYVRCDEGRPTSNPGRVEIHACWDEPKTEIGGAIGCQVARMAGSNERTLADAYLYASAPEMYELLSDIRESMRNRLDEQADSWLDDYMAEIDAVLSRAAFDTAKESHEQEPPR